MPARKHTRKATSAKKERQWEHVRQSEEARGVPHRQAIAIASGVLKRGGRRKKR